ncbi:BTAD domain-containing putative transcriptional regulator [Streptomyces sp. NPDC093097]|uniref:AfsR/SARP family transcriptional regulator n=1 Tax=Streptomyces sp. NPDC093097 TaxID=3366027 RepID=UPI0037F1FC91
MGDELSRSDWLNFTLLGPLSARAGTRPVAIGGPRQRVILAALVLAWGRVVSVDALIDAVWGEGPPASARTQVAICVGALRKAFRAAGWEDPVIVTAHPGYRLLTERSRVDVREFEYLVAKAGDVARRGRLEEAGRLHKRALDLWTGRPLTGVGGRLAEDAATRLEAQRLSAYEVWSEAQLALGRHQELIPVLSAVVKDYPQHEQFRHDLMLAQFRSGRRVEAAEGFRAWRRELVEELGLEPSLSMQQLHSAILRDEPRADAPGELPRPLAGTAAVRAVPAELPPDVPAFIGREAELRQLDALLADGDGGSAPPSGFVTGMAGVGKSSLLVHWAHSVAEKFPDGQLYVDLAEHERAGQPVTLHSLLGRFLRALGVDGEHLPVEQGERISLYRSMLADRRVLVLLDNVRTMEQVQSLTPGSGHSCVLVTTRDQQDHLAAVHGTVHLSLDLMTDDEAAEVVRRIAGPQRCDADPVAVAELSALCEGLPLALRVAATRLASKPHWSVRYLVNRLSDESRRLDELSSGGQEVRSSFASSYHALPEDVARMFRSLALLEMPDFAAWVGEALLGLPTAESEKLMEQLVDVNLLSVVGIEDTGTVRYRMHGLLRLYALEQAWAVGPAQETQEAQEAQEAYQRAWRIGIPRAREALQLRDAGLDFGFCR